MNETFSAPTADEVWRQAHSLLINGNRIAQKSRLGDTREILHARLHVEAPRQRWVLSRTPPLNPAFAIAEVLWILSGEEQASLLNYWNPVLPKFAGDGTIYYGAYGHRIRRRFGFDQLEGAYFALKNNPTSRQVVIQIWDPTADLPTYYGTPRDPDIPCNICAMLKIRDERLEWHQVMRSNDIYRGTPHNLIQFTCMQEILAGWLGIDVGSFHLSCDSLHIYEKDLKNCNSDSDLIVPNNPDNLALDKKQSDEQLTLLWENIKSLSNPLLTPKKYSKIINTKKIITTYRNLLLINAADSARRHGWVNEMNQAASMCTNTLLSLAFARWKNRKEYGRHKT